MKNIKPALYLKLIQRIKNKLKSDKVMQDMCKESNFDIDDIDLIPIKFGDIDVSARTDKGVITLNWLLLDGDDIINSISHYLVHEIKHYLDQSHEPTQSADDGDYLLNPSEQEAFQYQIKYINEEFGEDEADDYTEQVLDHHDEEGIERDRKKNILMKKVD